MIFKNLVLQALGFCKKSKKKISCLCTFKLSGCCCPGIFSVTRWFQYTDSYTQVHFYIQRIYPPKIYLSLFELVPSKTLPYFVKFFLKLLVQVFRCLPCILTECEINETSRKLFLGYCIICVSAWIVLFFCDTLKLYFQDMPLKARKQSGELGTRIS